MKSAKLLFVVFCFLVSDSMAQNDRYIYKMPSVKDVVENIKGADPMDQYARQIVALDILRIVVLNGDLKEHRSRESPKESQLIQQYIDGQRTLHDALTSKVDPLTSEAKKNQWNALIRKYSYNEDFKNEVVQKLLNDDLRKSYFVVQKNDSIRRVNKRHNDSVQLAEIKNQQAIQLAIRERNANKVSRGKFVILISFIGLIVAFAINFRLKKYEFNNMTSGGICAGFFIMFA